MLVVCVVCLCWGGVRSTLRPQRKQPGNNNSWMFEICSGKDSVISVQSIKLFTLNYVSHNLCLWGGWGLVGSTRPRSLVKI